MFPTSIKYTKGIKIVFIEDHRFRCHRIQL